MIVQSKYYGAIFMLTKRKTDTPNGTNEFRPSAFIHQFVYFSNLPNQCYQNEFDIPRSTYSVATIIYTECIIIISDYS